MPQWCKVCKEKGIKKGAYYGFVEGPPIFCKSCRPPDAEPKHPKRKMCICGKCRPSYNFEGMPPKYCADCKLPKMVGAKQHPRKCPCGKVASYNLPRLKARYCVSCKPDIKMVDVRSQRCVCGKQASHNVQGLPAHFCLTCKSNDMVRTQKLLKCIGVDDSKICPFNFTGQHYLKKRCSRCYQHEFPIEAAKRKMAYRGKEMQVKVFLASVFPDFIHDKPLWTEHCDCTLRRRIDFRQTIDNTMIAVECDEFQHRTYDERDKLARVNDLYMGFSGKFIYIRFNPDGYKDHTGKTRRITLKNRLWRLKAEIEKQMKRITNEENKELVEEIYLYYDGFNDAE